MFAFFSGDSESISAETYEELIIAPNSAEMEETLRLFRRSGDRKGQEMSIILSYYHSSLFDRFRSIQEIESTNFTEPVIKNQNHSVDDIVRDPTAVDGRQESKTVSSVQQEMIEDR